MLSESLYPSTTHEVLVFEATRIMAVGKSVMSVMPMRRPGPGLIERWSWADANPARKSDRPGQPPRPLNCIRHGSSPMRQRALRGPLCTPVNEPWTPASSKQKQRHCVDPGWESFQIARLCCAQNPQPAERKTDAAK